MNKPQTATAKIIHPSNVNISSSMIKPLVSVIIPVYNHEEFIGQALESIYKQNYPYYEIIVVDDGSTDRTAEIINSYRPKVIYIFKENGGTSSALNTGIKFAKGRYICWLSSDDQFLPGKLQKQVALFQKYPDYGMIYTDWYETDATGEIRRSYKSPDLYSRKEAVVRLLQGNCINGSTVMIKAECFKKVGYFKEHYVQSHDHDMWLRLARHYRFGHVNEPLIYYRRHHKNLSLQPDPLHEQRHHEMYEEARKFFNLSLPTKQYTLG